MSLTRHFRLAEILFAALMVLSGAARTQANELVAPQPIGFNDANAIDELSGLAVRGFDPVAYFDEGRPVAGKPDYEVIWHGAAWRFASAANRAAFLRDPQVYAPQAGGYDAQAALRGLFVDADPAFFAVNGGKLYLFRSALTREAFLHGQRVESAEAPAGRVLR
jgi:hypothetical protein